MSRPAKSIIERFENKYSPEPNTGCWLWLDSVDKDGYGRFRLKDKNYSSRASHVSYFIYNGVWPNFILHSCDNSSCVNPGHLIQGNAKENSLDRDSKNRTAKGQSIGKLSEKEILSIRKETSTYKIISEKYNISISSVFNIIKRKTWKHI